MHALHNAIKAHASAMDAAAGRLRWGIVQSVNATGSEARVMLQPEGVLSGWLPILSQSTGAGWGFHFPLALGAQVAVAADLGQAEHGVILGASWNNVDTPPMVPAAIGGDPVAAQAGKEIVAVGPAGQVLRFCADGSFYVQGPVNLMGNLTIMGNVTATGSIVAGQGGGDQVSLQTHKHPTAAMGGPSSPTPNT